MSKPNARSVRSKQAAILRYIASTDLTTSSSELGLSTSTLTRFVNAAPETIQKSPDRFSRALQIKPQQIAKEKGRRLVPRLSGERLRQKNRLRYVTEYVSPKGRKIKNDPDWTVRSLRYAEATRTHYSVQKEGKTVYVEIERERRRDIYAKRQLTDSLSGETTRSLINKYNAGTWTRGEALSAIRQLWKNSDVAFTPEQEAKYFGSDE
jgi:hypothetical protein